MEKKEMKKEEKREVTSMDGFFLRTDRERGTAGLYVRFRRGGVSMTLCTNIRVDVSEWKAAIQKSSKWNEYTKEGNAGFKVKQLMGDVNAEIDKLIAQGITSKDTFNEKIADIVGYETMERRKKSETQNLNHILAFYEYFMGCIERGEIKHDGKDYAEASVYGWRKYKKIIYGFCNEYQTFDDIDPMFKNKYAFYLESKGYKKTSRKFFLGCMKRLCRAANELGFNNNAISLLQWNNTHLDKQEVRAGVYLNDEEVSALYNMQLFGVEDEIRDIFILGILSCQRYSDYSKLTRDNFIINTLGVPVIALVQEKTKNYVEVPIIDERITAICEKYDYNFPRYPMWKFNSVIKQICQRLAAFVPSLNEEYETKLSMTERNSEKIYLELFRKWKTGATMTKAEKSMLNFHINRAYDHQHLQLFKKNEKGDALMPKWRLVSSHTARRSGVTNLYKTQLFDTHQIMSMSGHKSERVFGEYIKAGTSEQALRIWEIAKAAKEGKIKTAQEVPMKIAQ